MEKKEHRYLRGKFNLSHQKGGEEFSLGGEKKKAAGIFRRLKGGWTVGLNKGHEVCIRAGKETKYYLYF